MKKLFITAAIATMFSVTAFADGGKKAAKTTGEENISYTALNQFKTDFKNADNIIWTVTKNCQKVSFTDDSIAYTAFYNFDGEYLGLTHYIAYNTLSEAVKTEIADTYKDYVVGSVIKYETQQDDQLVYSVKVKTANGNEVEKATADEAVVYFVYLKNATGEVMLKVTADDSITPFKK